MSRGRDLPVMIGSGFRKGYIVARNKSLTGFDMWIVWLKKDFQTGESFELNDVEKVDSVLHFCDKKSVRQIIGGLETMLEMWGGEERCHQKG